MQAVASERSAFAELVFKRFYALASNDRIWKDRCLFDVSVSAVQAC
jgi:hypothetical protein